MPEGFWTVTSLGDGHYIATWGQTRVECIQGGECITILNQTDVPQTMSGWQYRTLRSGIATIGHRIGTFTVVGDASVTVVSETLSEEEAPFKRRFGWVDLWDLLLFAMPRDVQNKTYKPIRDELKEDYYLAYARFPGFITRLFVRLFFLFRTLLVLADCWQAIGAEKLKGFVPTSIKRLWSKLLNLE